VRRVLLAGLLLLVAFVVAYGYAVTRQERDFRQRLAEGDAALIRGDTEEAVRAFGDAILRQPDSMVGYLKRGAAHRVRGDLAAAAADLTTAARLDPMSPRALELLGDVALARAEYQSAVEYFEASVALDDRSAGVLYKLGLAEYLAGVMTDCDALERAVMLESRLAEAHYLLGICLRARNRSADAEQALRRATMLSPSLLPAREQLANLYGEQGRRLARVAESEQLLALDDHPVRHVETAYAYAAAGQVLRAVRLLRRTLEVFPDHPGAHLALGRIWLDASEHGRDRAALAAATTSLERAVTLEPSGRAWTLLGQAHLAASNVDEAERALARAAEMLPVDPPALLSLGELAAKAGRDAAARQALVAYAALTGDTRNRLELAQRIGDLSMRLGEPGTAATWYTRAAEGPRASAALLMRLAEAHRQAGAIDAARAAVAQALARDPDHAGARALARRLR
jgi:tetratricopeptide (TPR) repeat protein